MLSDSKRSETSAKKNYRENTTDSRRRTLSQEPQVPCRVFPHAPLSNTGRNAFVAARTRSSIPAPSNTTPMIRSYVSRRRPPRNQPAPSIPQTPIAKSIFAIDTNQARKSRHDPANQRTTSSPKGKAAQDHSCTLPCVRSTNYEQKLTPAKHQLFQAAIFPNPCHETFLLHGSHYEKMKQSVITKHIIASLRIMSIQVRRENP